MPTSTHDDTERRRMDVEMGDSFGMPLEPPASEIRERNRSRVPLETFMEEQRETFIQEQRQRRVSNHPWEQNIHEDHNSYGDDQLPNLNDPEEDSLAGSGRGLFDDLASDRDHQSQHSLPAVQNQSSKFVLDEDLPDSEIANVDIALKKADYGEPGTSEYRKNMAMATYALAEKFGVASHRVSSNLEEGDHSSKQYIQQTIVGILDRVKEGHQRAKMVDWMDICVLPKLTGNLRSLNPADWWDESETNLWTDWDRCTLTQIKAWQYSINKRFSAQDRTASTWLYLFVYNSSTHALRTEVSKKYDRVQKTQRGGVCYLYLTLCEMFQMSREVKDAMYTFLRLFRTKGIGRYTGENVLKASGEVLGICKRLEAANALLDDHLYDVLCGLSICTSARFRDTFKFLKQSEDASGRIQLPGLPHDATVMETIEVVLRKAEDLYDKLCTAGLWNRTKGGGADLNALVSLVHSCWNCGSEGHRVGDCPEARNEDTIAKNRQAFNDAKRSAGRGGGGRNQNGPQLGGRGRGNGGRGGRGGRGNGKRDTTANPDYQRKVWEAAGIVVAEGVALISCKTCGMNATHGTSHHSAYVSNPSSFSLPATHPLHTARQFAAKNGALVPYRPPANPQQPGPTGGPGGSANTLTIDKSEFENRLAAFERNSTDPNASDLSEAFRTLFLN